MAESVTHIAQPQHPYYPLEVEIVGYLANDWHFLTLLAAFTSGVAVIFTITFVLVKRRRPDIPSRDLATVLWFVLSGCIHVFFEGYYVYNFRNIATLNHFFAQLWKEYAYSDSRYLTQDPFVLCMETITMVCWGPLSFTVAALIVRNHPLRYPLQAIVSLGQLYGDVLYYATSLVDHFMLDITYSRPEAFYFWLYFVLMNIFWIIIPAMLIYSSIKHSIRAFRALERQEKLRQPNSVDRDTKKRR